MAATACTTNWNSLDCLRQVVSEGFVKLHTDLDKLRFEFKTEIDAVKLSIKDIEKSLTYTQSEVGDLKERLEMETKETSKEVNSLNKKIADLEDRLDFHRSLVSGLPSPRRDGCTRERQTTSVTSIPNRVCAPDVIKF